MQVIVSGGFDPVHVGHIRYFNAARALGTSLLVILNTDEFLWNKKKHIFMPFEERKEILLNLRSVDNVIKCQDDDQSVCKTLEYIHSISTIPLIFAKGGDRTLDNIPERTVCERLGIRMVFDIGGRKVQSSSELVNRVKT